MPSPPSLPFRTTCSASTAARRTRYMKELRTAIHALKKRINDFDDARCALWQRLEHAFNERMLARHNAEPPAVHDS